MNIMIVDDETGILEMLGETLYMNGYSCVLYNSPIDALNSYNIFPGDVVVVDLKMPEMNGITLLKEIRTCNPNARVIILTGYPELDNAIDAVNLGAYAYLTKPLDTKHLISLLDTVQGELLEEQKQKDEVQQMRKAFLHLYKDNELLQNTLDNAASSAPGDMNDEVM